MYLLKNKRKEHKNNFIFITPDMKGRKIVFKIQTVKWNDATQSNKTLSKQTITEDEFSDFMYDARQDGWKLSG
jgi:hypothetical protein